MALPQDEPWAFANVYVNNADSVVFVCTYLDDGEEEEQGSALSLWNGKDWVFFAPHNVTGTAFGVAKDPFARILLDKEGFACLWQDEGDYQDELVDPTENGPQFWGDLQDLRIIDSKAYVVGMARTAYVREGDRNWKRLDHKIRSEDEEEDAGFFSVDGFSATEIYAVGIDGEIAQYDGSEWRFITSPTNLILFRVQCAPDGKVYAVGQEGILLVGRGQSWETIDHDSTEETIWGTAWFNGALYCSTMEGIYRLEENQLVPVPIVGEDGEEIETFPGKSFYRLDANEEVIWSVGPKMVLWSTDGEVWKEVHYWTDTIEE